MRRLPATAGDDGQVDQTGARPAGWSDRVVGGAIPLAGRVALVTGASSGLGRATALALAEAGADVALFARSQPELASVAAEIERLGRRPFPAAVDLADPDATTRAFDQVTAAAGRLDILANVAATDAPGPAEALTVADWDRVLAVNLRAPFLLAKLAFPHLRDAGGGTIVNISSVAGKRGWANATAYCAAKFGLTGLTQALAAEGAPHRIRVCVLYPGAMATHWGSFDPHTRSGEPPAAPAADQGAGPSPWCSCPLPCRGQRQVRSVPWICCPD